MTAKGRAKPEFWWLRVAGERVHAARVPVSR